MPLVESGKRKTKFRAKLIEGQFGNPGLSKNMVRCAPYGRQVIYERARPVENDIPNHPCRLTQDSGGAMLSKFARSRRGRSVNPTGRVEGKSGKATGR